MKKILLMLSLLVVGMFLVGCATGEAISRSCDKTAKECGFLTKAPKLECKEFGNPAITTTGNAFCKEQGYDTCTDVGIWITVHFYKDSNLTIYDHQKIIYSPGSCELNPAESENKNIKSWEDYEDFIVKAFVGDNPTSNYKSGSSDGVITCCKLS